MKGLAKKYEVDKQQLVRVVSMCQVLEKAQLIKIVNTDETMLDTLLGKLAASGRIVRNNKYIAVDTEALNNPKPEMIAAVWILTELVQRTEYYTAGEFPAQLCFFIDGVEYEIIYVTSGREALITKAVSDADEPPRRFIIIEDTGQINKINIKNISAFCTVQPDGKITYYKKGTSDGNE